MRGTQTLAAASTNQHHPLHYVAQHPHMPRNIKTTPSTRYHTQILSPLTPCTPQTNLQKHIHTQITHQSIETLKNNTQLHARPPDIHPPESFLPREDRVHLARLRYGHNPALLTYQKRLDGAITDACPGCNTAPHSIKHIMEDCNTHNHTRQQHNIHSLRVLWESPVQAMTLLRSSGLLGQTA
ncbi:hypothetical protein Pcinc_012988 [Petrolisthes cinctipes]|uniref:Reverse transcriptase n=1 Tax=Petrolisthes cinctipes TaxID=88211 RepID=A0AAE1KT41_PETCI|nr:hypothetical protein Pcinc_012988 [Petrolisthes cinctipes]